jgi:hypothetical protein
LDAVRVFLFLFLAGLPALQAQEDDGIPWDSGRRLSWSDFQATPPESQRVAATTASGISYSYSTRGTPGNYRLDYKVLAYFYPERSWYHPEICDSVILSHEQLHFDISELFARKMRDALGRRTFSKNVRAEVRQIFSEINRELSEFQDLYDRETDFSRNREQQATWNRRISKMLERGG